MYHLIEVLMSRTHDTDVDRDRLAAADTFDHPFLDKAQQLDLKRQRYVAHLVEEQRTALGKLDLAFGRLSRSGERALFIAEQLGLQQIFRNRGAVDRNKGRIGPPAGTLDTQPETRRAGKECVR